jgi:hypothetical protein
MEKGSQGSEAFEAGSDEKEIRAKKGCWESAGKNEKNKQPNKARKKEGIHRSANKEKIPFVNKKTCNI